MRDTSIATKTDLTLLRADATVRDYEALFTQAQEYGVRAVCVPPWRVQAARERLAGTSITVATVVGFPYGYDLTNVKMTDAVTAVISGATEIDMVMHLGRFFSGEHDIVRADIASIVRASACAVKVILETALMTNEQIVAACRIAEDAGAHFVKTSTGTNPAGGATVEAVRLMRDTVSPHMGVKASGGIRTNDVAHAMVVAGATVIGTSHLAAMTCADLPEDFGKR